MAKAMPKIQDLELNGCFGTNAKPVKPATLKRFVRSLDQPLDSLTLGTCEWLRDEHLQALLPNTDLMSLSLYQCVQYEDDSSDDDVWGWQPARKTCLTDKGLEVIGRCCDRLHDLTLTYLDITTRGVECALRGPGETLSPARARARIAPARRNKGSSSVMLCSRGSAARWWLVPRRRAAARRRQHVHARIHWRHRALQE